MHIQAWTAGGIAALVMALCSNAAIADPLTRSSCWTATFDGGVSRTVCFSGSRTATMRNRNHVINSDAWSTCEWNGDYTQGDSKLTVSFAQGSGRCSNGAASPKFTMTCDFDSNQLTCDGTSVVDGQTFHSSYTFE